ncbi:MAG: hypothetical protein K2I96_25245 [Lachnospiraceae bacterium]|nr:hypothetical protein [Lachnospiraceae bacterium]
MNKSKKRMRYQRRTRAKRSTVLTGVFILGVVFIFVTILIILNNSRKMDGWIGGYIYSEFYPHNSGEIYYGTAYRITIWKHDNEYYAAIEGSGWHLGTWGLAYVAGDDQQIDIIAMQTLPGDSYFGKCERYEKGEVLVHFERRGEELITEWKALRDQHPILTYREDAIIGNYFEKVK